MFIFDQSLLGRKYFTLDPKTTYTLRGIYVQPNSKPIVMGEFTSAQNTFGSTTKLVTHQLSEITLA